MLEGVCPCGLNTSSATPGPDEFSRFRRIMPGSRAFPAAVRAITRRTIVLIHAMNAASPESVKVDALHRALESAS